GQPPLAHASTQPHVVTHAAPVAAGSGTSFITEVQNWALQWQPVLMFVFFTAIILVMWRTLKVMPRIKPQQIKPASSQAVSFARKHEPAIIFIDELDAVGGRRGADISGEKDQTLNQLLVEMDGFSSSGRVVVIAASNLLEKLDPALLRPGRFDRQVFVMPPDVKGREGVLAVHTRQMPLHEVDLSLVAQQTSGLTGADLANICNEAAISAARRGAGAIVTADFDAALERVIAGVQSRRV